MLDITTTKKIKLNLSDYNFKKDIKNRILISQFTALDIAVLEEILFSPLKISLTEFINNQDLSKDPNLILKSLEKLKNTELLNLQGEWIIVDKGLRKYFDFQILTFEDDFQPNLEFIYHLLKKVPIHVLPPWYALPKTSTNIFQSIIDKFLSTPPNFERHLKELKQKDDIFQKLIEEVYTSPYLEAKAPILKSKYKLSDFEFHKILLFLEFSFALCLTYNKTKNGLEEKIVPFWHWQKYLTFLQKTKPTTIADNSRIKREHVSDFGFLEDFIKFLQKIIENPLAYDVLSLSKAMQDEKITSAPCTRLLPKALFLKLVKIHEGKLQATDNLENFLQLPMDKQSLKLLENPTKFMPFSQEQIKTAAGSIERALKHEWLDLDKFVEGIIIPLDPDKNIKLTGIGKNISYELPIFSADEKKLFKHVICSYLYEAGITAIGHVVSESQKPVCCFKVTNFGKKIFEI